MGRELYVANLNSDICSIVDQIKNNYHCEHKLAKQTRVVEGRSINYRRENLRRRYRRTPVVLSMGVCDLLAPTVRPVAQTTL